MLHCRMDYILYLGIARYSRILIRIIYDKQHVWRLLIKLGFKRIELLHLVAHSLGLVLDLVRKATLASLAKLLVLLSLLG